MARRLCAFGLAAVLSFAFTAYAAANEVRLIFATNSPAGSIFNARVLHPWAEAINADGKGIVHIDVRDGYTLSNFENIYDRVGANVLQIGFGLETAVGGKFPKSEFMGLPFVFDRSDDASAAYWRLYQSGALQSEFSDIVPLFMGVTEMGQLHMTKPVRSVDNLAGLKIGAVSKITADVISRLDGVPLSIPLTEFYTALQRGTLNGILLSWSGFPPFKLGEVLHTHYQIRLGGASGCMVFMSKSRYDALPAAVREVLQRHSGEQESRALGAYWLKIDGEVRAQYEHAPGHTIVNVAPEQASRLKAKIEPLVTEWLASHKQSAEAYEKFRKILAEVEAKH